MKMMLVLVTGILLACNAGAAIVNVDNVLITEVTAYDDFEGGIIRIQMPNTHASYGAGSYLNLESTGFKHLYSLLLLQASSGKSARFQLYYDRKVEPKNPISAGIYS